MLLNLSPSWQALNFKEARIASVLFNELSVSEEAEYIDLKLVEEETRMEAADFIGAADSLLEKNLIRVNKDGDIGLDGDLLRLFNEKVSSRRRQ